MNRDELNLKLHDLIQSHDRNNNPDVFSPWSFNACADILLPEIERLNFNHKHLHDSWAVCINKIKELEKEGGMLTTFTHYRDLIQKFEKENAELKEKNKVALAYTYHPCLTGDCPHAKQTECDESIKSDAIEINKLTAQLTLCKEQRDNYINNSYNGYQNGNQFEIDESNKQLEAIK